MFCFVLAPQATNQNAISEINGIFYNFLCDNKGEKVKKMVLINDYWRSKNVRSFFK